MGPDQDQYHVRPQGSHRPGKVLEFDLGPGKLLESEKSAFCPGIVLEFCKIILENMNWSLINIKYRVLSDLWDAKMCEIVRYTLKREVRLIFYSIQFLRQFWVLSPESESNIMSVPFHFDVFG